MKDNHNAYYKLLKNDKKICYYFYIKIKSLNYL